jgi:hypothetical protein
MKPLTIKGEKIMFTFVDFILLVSAFVLAQAIWAVIQLLLSPIIAPYIAQLSMKNLERSMKTFLSDD